MLCYVALRAVLQLGCLNDILCFSDLTAVPATVDLHVIKEISLVPMINKLPP